MSWNKIFLILGLIFIFTGIFLPRGWYETLPKSDTELPWIKQTELDSPTHNLPPPPVKGVTLLQVSFVIEGLVFLWLGLRRRTYIRLSSDERLLAAPEKNKIDFSSASLWLIAAITVLALVLRLFRLDSELWLDEIATVVIFNPMPVLHVITAFISPNNHLLNSLLIKLAVAFFGEHEWVFRLPAAVFGAATIPVFYWVARLTLSQRTSLCAALLLAASYHHIFFSQNARGYTMQIFFTTLACGLFVKALQEDRLPIWILYVAAMVLNMASILNSGFVFAAHVLVGAAALLIIKRRGFSPRPLLYRLAAVFGAITLLVFQLYATFIPQAYVYTQALYKEPGNGFSFFSTEFLAEMIRGISAGFGSSLMLLALPFAAATVGIGFIVLFKRNWVLITLLALPVILTLTHLIINQINVAPRFFLIAFPFAILVVVQGIESIAQFVAAKISRAPNALSAKMVTAAVLLGCAVSLFSLKRYYAVPKQPYRTSLAHIAAQRQPGEIIIAASYADSGYRFYAEEFNLTENVDFFAVRSVDKLDSVLSMHDGRKAYLVTTLSRNLRLKVPELAARIAQDWEVVQTFPATIGDAEILVWRLRQSNR